MSHSFFSSIYEKKIYASFVNGYLLDGMPPPHPLEWVCIHYISIKHFLMDWFKSESVMQNGWRDSLLISRERRYFGCTFSSDLNSHHECVAVFLWHFKVLMLWKEPQRVQLLECLVSNYSGKRSCVLPLIDCITDLPLWSRPEGKIVNNASFWKDFENVLVMSNVMWDLSYLKSTSSYFKVFQAIEVECKQNNIRDNHRAKLFFFLRSFFIFMLL